MKTDNVYTQYIFEDDIHFHTLTYFLTWLNSFHLGGFLFVFYLFISSIQYTHAEKIYFDFS